MDYQSKSIQVRNVGVGKRGAEKCFAERLAAIFVFLTFFWFLHFCHGAASKSTKILLEDLKLPHNFLGAMLFVVTSFYHSLLGMEVVIEDYIHNLKLRHALITLLRIFVVITVASFIVALIYLLIY
ncbi:sdhD succinate dehydrogenase hydrophobic membrane anchor protein [Candidatus Phycorickettsia trachydisci]|uniref:Succinate dehydrogenase hydrophobic membrane anchor subunit n=1 Tax=Candidatus Phycorickettsia trachydisci TaxID=2115978 RepID=A0A2P1P874_9RICK|nr:succinate dehydrogenase, hydrophobic membrane anchor protein [Candidatus Phycorickettsia trachydisci]AVP87454.1 sdhD succinate dehydrogenase hydrophobic membrane anchor protein [Candidatus Phycorickettsia trachydisci]